MVPVFYPAVVEPDGKGGYGVIFPDFPGCVSSGDDVDGACRNAIEALILHVEGMLDDGEALPGPSLINKALPDWLGGVDLSKSVRVLVPIEVEDKVVRVNITIEEGLLARISTVAEVRGMSRSAFFAEAARRLLKAS